MPKQRPEQGVSYARPPTEEHRAATVLEAVKGLAKAWGITETRAAECLADHAEYQLEMRAHMTPRQAMREMERRYAAFR
jgi:hypothetical protein